MLIIFHNYIRKDLLFFKLHLFLTVLSAQGTDALKNDALFPELLLLDTLHCPKIIAVFDGPYCLSVGLAFKPFRMPLCWPNKFSTISELK